MTQTHSRLLEVDNLVKWFPVDGEGLIAGRKSYLKAVDGVSFHIEDGETLGLVGESGCGKSTTGRAILRLIEATSGKVCISGENIYELGGNALKKKRKDMQIVFQDPYASLNPRLTVKKILEEPLNIHTKMTRAEKQKKIEQLLDEVGMKPEHAHRYPHQFSGGQRQRIGIARALAVNPKLIIMDEPVSALDVSVQAQILNLLKELQQKYGLTYLFITHDLSVVKYISNRIAVMYMGKIVEIAEKKQFFRSSLHPYTKALISAIPSSDPEEKKERILLKGDVPNPVDPPQGCRFHTRCPMAESICKQQEPALKEYEKGHYAACHLV